MHFNNFFQDNFSNFDSDALFRACRSLETNLFKQLELKPYVIPYSDFPLSLLEEMIMADPTFKTNIQLEENSDPQSTCESQQQDFLEAVSKKTYFSISTKDSTNSSNKASKIVVKRINLRSDSMNKRIKAAVNSYIFKRLSLQVKHEESQIFFFSLPSYFSNNLNLQLNKRMLSMTIREIYSFITSKFGDKDKKRMTHNINIMNKVSSDDLNNLLSKTWKEMYEEYMKTEDYQAYLDHIYRKEGPVYYTHFLK